ncbi:MAG: NmrA family NAD(P)-binding protein [Gemmatimonadetes bacterium]|nr:NmrA family NAD(P)-binding protein [Gemmatimonadota bacterium]
MEKDAIPSTGATGQQGVATARALPAEEGHKVVAMTRNPSSEKAHLGERHVRSTMGSGVFCRDTRLWRTRRSRSGRGILDHYCRNTPVRYIQTRRSRMTGSVLAMMERSWIADRWRM